MTAINESLIDPVKRKNAEIAWQNMENAGRPFMLLLTSWEAMVESLWLMCVTFVCWYYILPHFPGVKFDGTVYDAARAAITMCVVCNFWGVLWWESVRLTIKGVAHGKLNWPMFLLSKTLKYASLPVQLLAVAVTPIYHIRLETWAGIGLVYLTISAFALVVRIIVDRVVPKFIKSRASLKA